MDDSLIEQVDTYTDGAEIRVQRVLFAPPAAWIDPALYFRVSGSTGAVREPERGSIVLDPHTLVRTDTYFGRLRAAHWQRWTSVATVTVRATVDPGVTVMLCLEDIGGHITVASIDDAVEDSAEAREVSLEVPLNRFVDGGAVHVAFSTAESGGEVRDVSYWVSAEHVQRDIPTDLVICTYNRPVDCARTVAMLAEDVAALARVRRIRVIDQGDQHPEDEVVFKDAAEILGDRLVVVRQPNLGGAGGFSRGMRDATEAGECLVLLTDDDIRPEPETTLRLSTMGCFTDGPMILGAQMMCLHNPSNLYITGERYDWKRFTWELTDPLYSRVNVDVREEHQLRRLGAEYNGWWTCLIPSEVISEIGLALPVFFQFDDIEFAYRAAAAGFPTDTIPGAAVWHADFYWKDLDSPTAFFGNRNSLIMAALNPHVNGREVARVFSERILFNLVSMRYGFVWTILEGIKEMMKGPSVLSKGSVGDFGDVVGKRKKFPDTELLPVSAIPQGVMPVRPPTREIKSDGKVLAKRIAYTQIGKKRPGPVAVAFEDNFWWHISAFDEVWLTDASQAGVRHLKRDRDLEKALYKEVFQVMKEIAERWDELCEQWQEAAPELVSPENWERHFTAE